MGLFGGGYGPGGDPRKQDPTKQTPGGAPGYQPNNPAPVGQPPVNLPYGPGRTSNDPMHRPDISNTNTPARSY